MRGGGREAEAASQRGEAAREMRGSRCEASPGQLGFLIAAATTIIVAVVVVIIILVIIIVVIIIAVVVIAIIVIAAIVVSYVYICLFLHGE